MKCNAIDSCSSKLGLTCISGVCSCSIKILFFNFKENYSWLNYFFNFSKWIQICIGMIITKCVKWKAIIWEYVWRMTIVLRPSIWYVIFFSIDVNVDLVSIGQGINLKTILAFKTFMQSFILCFYFFYVIVWLARQKSQIGHLVRRIPHVLPKNV